MCIPWQRPNFTPSPSLSLPPALPHRLYTACRVHPHPHRDPGLFSWPHTCCEQSPSTTRPGEMSMKVPYFARTFVYTPGLCGRYSDSGFVRSEEPTSGTVRGSWVLFLSPPSRARTSTTDSRSRERQLSLSALRFRDRFSYTSPLRQPNCHPPPTFLSLSFSLLFSHRWPAHRLYTACRVHPHPHRDPGLFSWPHTCCEQSPST